MYVILFIPDAPKKPGRQVSGDTLIFRAVVPDSTAVFQCNASNQYGYILANAFLAVIGKFCRIQDYNRTFINACHYRNEFRFLWQI